ncbi:hypothetical protein Pmani_038666 [Petrolisthes manimaculis]|uniref:Uncharacterized protein n=1 Tax=Petrolisthes manimaculis TaxID=1843537 RepID=A0AAE1NFP9_9EUCA|nr:hypothetical protein Pmani_038666 [Petrolisthes manimaculis]
MKHQGTTERASAAASTRLKTILMLVTCGAVAVTGDCNSTKTEMSNQPVNLHLNTQADIVSLCYNADHPDTVATINLGLYHPLAFTTSRMNEIGCVNIYYNTKLNRTFVLGSSVQTKEYQQVKKFPSLFIVSNNTMEWITCDGTMSTLPPDDICPKPLQNEMTNDQNPKPQPGKVDFVELAMGSAIGVLLLLNFGTCAGLIHYRKMALLVAESNSKRRSGRVVYSNAPQSKEEEKEQEEEKHTASTKSPELDIYEEWDNSWHQHNPPSRHESENSLYQAGPWLTPTSDTHVIED